WSYSRAFCCTGPTGATSTRLSLRPLFDEGETDAKLGQFTPRERGLVLILHRHARQRVGAYAPPDDRLRRASSTPRLLGSSTVASGILDRPVKPDDDSGELFEN